MATENSAWQLEDFVDSLVVELDKTREILAVKAINKPLSYSVKELALDLNIFPTYDGDSVKFITAQPGQEGASKVSIQLGSITDQQVRATTKTPSAKDKNDISIEDTDLDKPTKKKLRAMGVSSVSDLKQVEQKNVDLKKVTDNEIDYTSIANHIQKVRRSQTPPKVQAVSLSVDENRNPILLVKGEHLAVDPKFPPVAVINQNLAEVMSSSEQELRIQVKREHAMSLDNELILTFDPFAIVKMNVKVRP